MMQAEIKQAELTIQGLTNDKDSLKSALSSAVKKKETFYKLLIEYKQALENSNKKILKLKSALDEAQMIHSDISKLKSQLTKRDEKIRVLIKQNQKLESALAQYGTEESMWKKMYKDSQNELSEDFSDLNLTVDILLQRIKGNPHFHKLFKACFPCVNYFRDLVGKGKIEEVFVKTCRFVEEIVKDAENVSSEILRDRTGRKVESDEEFLTTGDDERIEKLNLELKNAVAKSKAVLNNRELSVSTLNFPTEAKSLENLSKSKPRTSNSSAKMIPKIEIHRKSSKNV